jgi:hypothetical protein
VTGVQRLPAAPLVTAIRSAAVRRNVPVLTLLEGNRVWARAVYRAAQRGWVALEVAEELCEQALGWHPRMVYGDAWDHASTRAAHGAARVGTAQPHATRRGTRRGIRRARQLVRGGVA